PTGTGSTPTPSASRTSPSSSSTTARPTIAMIIVTTIRPLLTATIHPRLLHTPPLLPHHPPPPPLPPPPPSPPPPPPPHPPAPASPSSSSSSATTPRRRAFPLDDAALRSLFRAATTLFFAHRLSNRVAWDWSHASSSRRYAHHVVGTTALRRSSAPHGGYET